MNKSTVILALAICLTLSSPAAAQSNDWNDDNMRKAADAAEKGDPTSQNWIGEIYSRKRINPAVYSDYVEAFKWFKLAADQGNVQAKINLAEAYAKGNGTKRDTSKAIEIYNQVAEYDCDIMAEMANKYSTGKDGFPNDYKLAVYWWERMYGPPPQCLNVWIPGFLARAYAFEDYYGIKQDLEKAYFWALFVQEHEKTYGRIGREDNQQMIKNVFALPVTNEQKQRAHDALEELRGKPLPYRKSYSLEVDIENNTLPHGSSSGKVYLKLKADHEAFLKSDGYILQRQSRRNDLLPEVMALAEQGNMDAQLAVAQFYDRLAHKYIGSPKKGIKQYPEAEDLAFKWWLKVADAGNTDAQMKISDIYEKRGDSQNSIRYAQRAANGGHSKANFKLGLLTYYGLGIEQNTQQALHFFNQAAQYGDSRNWVGAIKGDAQAQVNLSISIINYKSLPNRVEESAFWAACAMQKQKDVYFLDGNGNKVHASTKWSEATAQLDTIQIEAVKNRLVTCP